MWVSEKLVFNEETRRASRGSGVRCGVEIDSRLFDTKSKWVGKSNLGLRRHIDVGKYRR